MTRRYLRSLIRSTTTPYPAILSRVTKGGWTIKWNTAKDRATLTDPTGAWAMTLYFEDATLACLIKTEYRP